MSDLMSYISGIMGGGMPSVGVSAPGATGTATFPGAVPAFGNPAPQMPGAPAVGAFTPGNATAPLSISSPNSMLDPKQQFRISQAMRDLSRIQAAQGKTAFNSAQQKSQSAYGNAAGNMQASLGFGNLQQGAQLGQAQQSLDYNWNTANNGINNNNQMQAIDMTGQMLSPLMSQMMQLGMGGA